MDLTQLSDLEVLTLTLIGEARGEPIEGIVAVGCVIRNRLHGFEKKYKSYYDVCTEQYQFSCWNLKDPNRPFLEELATKLLNGQDLTDPYLKQCQWVAQGIINWWIIDNTKGARNYMTTDLFNLNRPKWARGATNILIKGRQTFFHL